MDDELDLPCGCKIGTIDSAFTVMTCAAGTECEWVQFILAEGARQDKPHTILEM